MKALWRVILFIIFNILIGAGASARAEFRLDGDETEYVVVPYFWQTTTDTTVTSEGGYVVPFQLDVEDVIEAMDKGAAFVFEARQGKYVLSTEVTYIDAANIKSSVLTPIGEIPLVIDTESVIVEVWMGQHFGDEKNWVELYMGARQVEYSSDATAMGQNVSSHSAWHEPLLAFQIHKSLTNKIAFDSRASVGGFSEEKSSYDVAAGFVYRHGKSIYFMAGYRHQHFQYEEEGHNPVHMKTYGPYIAVGKRF